MKTKIEKQLRELLKQVRSKDEPFPNITADIEEYLQAEEWELALGLILDWAEATHKLTIAKKEAALIRSEMKRLAAK